MIVMTIHHVELLHIDCLYLPHSAVSLTTAADARAVATIGNQASYGSQPLPALAPPQAAGAEALALTQPPPVSLFSLSLMSQYTVSLLVSVQVSHITARWQSFRAKSCDGHWSWEQGTHA